LKDHEADGNDGNICIEIEKVDDNAGDEYC
jgi:hypothetical protein